MLREQLDELVREHPDQFQVTHVLSHADDSWKGERGYVSKDQLQKYCFAAKRTNLALVCGPPAMITKAVMPGLKELGYHEEENLFGFWTNASSSGSIRCSGHTIPQTVWIEGQLFAG